MKINFDKETFNQVQIESMHYSMDCALAPVRKQWYAHWRCMHIGTNMSVWFAQYSQVHYQKQAEADLGIIITREPRE